MSSFCIVNLGCKVNRVEADSMAAVLLQAGAVLSSPAEAQVVIINTCTVTGEADAKSRKAVGKAARQAPNATIIVCGCGAQVEPDQFKLNETVVEVIAHKDTALQRAAEILALEIKDEPAFTSRVQPGFNTRVALKVQDGCNQSCSYCIVPRARGPARSVALQQVLAELSVQTEAGAKELVLTGIDLGSYQDNGKNLVHLLTEVLELGNDFRVRLSSIELPSITKQLLELIARSRGRICAHLHIPLQSGSNTVLSAMRRRYNAQDFLEVVRQIRALLPQVALSTDVIVGFPGESTQDFLDTLQVCEMAGFSRMHIFRYSERPGTPAALFPHKVPSTVSAERAKQLRALAAELASVDAHERLGSLEKVLVERTGIGRSESYYQVQIPANLTQGNLVTMRISGYEQGMLTADRTRSTHGTDASQHRDTPGC